MANIKSQKKRNLTNEKNRQRNQAYKSSLRTSVRKLRAATESGDREKAGALLVATNRQFDKAVSAGVIHQNQAANKKSALTKAVDQI